MSKERNLLAISFGIASAALILVALFIPNLLWVRKKANESSAKKMIRTIDAAELRYRSEHPDLGFTCSFEQLDKESVPQDSSAEISAGYLFRLSKCCDANDKGTTRNDHFLINALPIALGKSGDKAFCSDESSRIRFDPKGGADCIASIE